MFSAELTDTGRSFYRSKRKKVQKVLRFSSDFLRSGNPLIWRLFNRERRFIWLGVVLKFLRSGGFHVLLSGEIAEKAADGVYFLLMVPAVSGSASITVSHICASQYNLSKRSQAVPSF